IGPPLFSTSHGIWQIETQRNGVIDNATSSHSGDTALAGSGHRTSHPKPCCKLRHPAHALSSALRRRWSAVLRSNFLTSLDRVFRTNPSQPAARNTGAEEIRGH